MRRIVIVTLAALLGAALIGPGSALAGKGGKGGGNGGGGGGGGGTPASPEITWMQRNKKTWDVMVMDADGGNQAVAVKNVGTSLAMPSWSADGTEVVFSAGSSFEQGRGLYRAPIDGSATPELVVATGTTVIGPVWSPTAAPDGNEWIAFQDVRPAGEYGMDIFVVSPDGGTADNLTSALGGSFQYPCWSDDASQLAVAWRHTVNAGTADEAVRNDLVLLDLVTDTSGNLIVDADNITNLTDAANSPLRSLADTSVAGDQDYHASWGRTGDTLVVEIFDIVGTRDNHDVWEIPIASPASAVERTGLTGVADASHTVAEHHPSYAPDDTEAVFWLRGKSDRDSGIYTVDLDGSGTLTELVGEYSVRDPSWFRGN